MCATQIRVRIQGYEAENGDVLGLSVNDGAVEGALEEVNTLELSAQVGTRHARSANILART